MKKNKKLFKTNPIKKKTPKNLLAKPKPIKNTPSYYLCMGACCKGKNITQVAKECKTNAPALVAQRKKKVQELQKAAHIIGKFANDLEKVLQH